MKKVTFDRVPGIYSYFHGISYEETWDILSAEEQKQRLLLLHDLLLTNNSRLVKILLEMEKE
jgi:hypothetical protein